MKKVVLASLLALAGAGPLAQHGFSQAAAQTGAPAAGQIQMSPEEYAAYNNAGTQTTPAAQAAAWEAYLKAYPQSAVKEDALQKLVFAYSQVDPAKTLEASDRLLQVNPNNFYALVFEVTLRVQNNQLDSAADYARKGLAATKPASMSDADWTGLKAKGYPVFYNAIGTAALGKKDSAAAVEAFKSELGSVPIEATKTPGPQLQDTFNLGQAYYTLPTPDYLNCAYYAGRAMAYAPEPYKTTFRKTAIYCYHKFHGQNDEGFDAMVAVAKDNLTPPSTLNVKPAPKPEDIVSNLIATTPDLATLAISDKEYVLQNGKKEDADKVFDTVKGKSVTFPDAVVLEGSTPDTLKVAVSEDAVQSKTADFAFTMKAPLATLPAVGTKVSVSGTYSSYTQSPILITMTDGAVTAKAAAKKAAPAAHKPAARKR